MPSSEDQTGGDGWAESKGEPGEQGGCGESRVKQRNFSAWRGMALRLALKHLTFNLLHSVMATAANISGQVLSKPAAPSPK